MEQKQAEEAGGLPAVIAHGVFGQLLALLDNLKRLRAEFGCAEVQGSPLLLEFPEVIMIGLV